jgi:hypothetical protein
MNPSHPPGDDLHDAAIELRRRGVRHPVGQRTAAEQQHGGNHQRLMGRSPSVAPTNRARRWPQRHHVGTSDQPNRVHRPGEGPCCGYGADIKTEV